MGSLRDPVTTEPAKGEIADALLKDREINTAITRQPQTFEPYISGYVDGEGCFTVSVNQRSKMVTGWEIRPSFSVSQNHDRSELLYLMMEYFDCGSIRSGRSDRTLKYEVRSLTNLTDKVIPHFERYPLLSGKQASFLLFRDICLAMVAGKHRDPDVLPEILRQASDINSGKRKYTFGKI